MDPVAAPPGLSAPEHLARATPEELGEKRPSRRIGLIPLVLTVVVTALVAFLAGRSVRAPQEPSVEAPPHVNDLARQVAEHDLEAQFRDLERRGQLLEQDEARLEDALDRLVGGNQDLARNHEVSLRRARNLRDRLESFAGGVSRTDPAATRLADEARGYAKALEGVIELLESERQATLDRAQDLTDRLDHRALRGRRIRVIHDEERLEDARRIVDLLGSLEMEAEIFPAEIADPKRHKGRLFFSTDEEEAPAAQIVRLVEDFEPIQLERLGVASPYLSLWIVGEKPYVPQSRLDDEENGELEGALEGDEEGESTDDGV